MNLVRVFGVPVFLAVFGFVAPGAQLQTADNTAQAKLHYQNAVAAIGKSDWQTAKNELVQAEKLAPENALVHYDLGLAYSHMGQVGAARSELNKAIQLGLQPELKKQAERLRQQLASQAAASKSSNSTNSEAQVMGQEVGTPGSGPSVAETLDFLQRMIGKPTVQASGHMGNIDYETFSQGAVIAGTPSCFISWDDVSYLHWKGGTAETDRDTRYFISLKDLLISDVTVVDLKTFALGRYDSNGELASGNSDTQYSGYVLVIKQSADASNHYFDIPNPSGIHGHPNYDIFPAGHAFFDNESDAERAEKALIHAATLCGAKKDPF